MSSRTPSHKQQPKSLVRRLLRPFELFQRPAVPSGLLLFASAAVALVWANSPFAATYTALLHAPLFGETAGHWINDGLMTVFFLLVGLEIKREILVGELASMERAALPMVGALGGMIVPALCFAFVARGTAAIAGWGIPMATDIAFALGVLTLLGRRVPTSLKVFLAALAIVDDLGAVLVIALFYTASLNLAAMGAAAALLLVLALLNVKRVRSPLPYLGIGVLLWMAVLRSGVHATIAGVLLAMTVPADGDDAPLIRIERALNSTVQLGIMPLFALANAGVLLPPQLTPLLREPAAFGAMLGLIVGKPVGILAACVLAVKTRLAALPDGVGWGALAGVAMLGGVGFTMSLFIGALAFGETEQLRAAKVGVICGSLVAGVLGSAWLRWRLEEGRE